MKEKIDPNMHVIDIVLRAMQESGVPPRVEPIRGGTDGAQLSFKGLPCPNIFAGGVNFHGPHEFVSIQVMEKVVQTIVKIAEITAEIQRLIISIVRSFMMPRKPEHYIRFWLM